MIIRYQRVAEIRAREMPTRLGFAVFIATTSWVYAPSVWPAIWLAAIFAGQSLDWLVFRNLRRKRSGALPLRNKVLICGTILLNATIYSSISILLWSSGGSSGMVFGSVLVAGAMLHVSIHLHHVREVMLCGVTPAVIYFLALPINHAVASGKPQELLIAVGCVLYMTHLLVAVRQSSETNHAIHQANRQAQIERRRAEVASAAKSDFLAVVSHEIRTPMNAVMTAANLLDKSELTPPQREQVVMLKDAGEVLLGLLNDVLDFSKIGAGKMVLEHTHTDLTDKLASLRRMWGPKADEKGIGLVLDIAEDVPAHVLTDPLRLQQILFNLISNAVKFTDVGEVRVTALWDDDRHRLEVRVSDTGCGIPEDRLAHVFEVFEQVDAGVTRRRGGTGLGLAISRKLAELMDGELTAQSTPGVGSTFLLSLPMTVDLSPEQHVDVGEEISLPQGLRILAADDHPVNRQILAMLLEPTGCVLEFAADGGEAVEAANRQAFDAILMDMQMPVLDGVAATAALRAGDGPNRQTPVIALTANAMDCHREAWAEVGVEDFLTKPIDVTLLIQTLARVAARQASTDQLETAAAHYG